MDEFVVPLAELARTLRPRAAIGGKAYHLAQLLAAGLPVPEGMVVTTAAVSLDDEEVASVFEWLQNQVQSSFEGPLAVRSSAVMEDDVVAAAPGIFASILGVDFCELEASIRKVWASAQAPLVREYAAVRGVHDLSVAAIVQQLVPPPSMAPARRIAGVLYTRLPARQDSDEMLLETHSGLDTPAQSQRMPRSGALAETWSFSLSPWMGAALRELGLQAERAIEAPAGADVEWVISDEKIWIVQARPIIHPPARPKPRFPEALLRFSTAEPELIWRLDVTHNPEPLSLAQAGLVERMARAGVAPYRMRVVGGYLYTATGDFKPSTDVPSAGELRDHFERELRPAMEAALTPGESPGADLATALAGYEQFYRVYAEELTPILSTAKRVLPAFLRECLDEDSDRLASRLLAGGSSASLEGLIARVARGEVAFEILLEEAGPMSPVWDVACRTFAELPGALEQAVERSATMSAGAHSQATDIVASLRGRLEEGDTERFDQCLALARTARDIGEMDDRLYARAQAAVRHALLRLARLWGLVEEEDIFHVPLEYAVNLSHKGATPDALRIHRMAQAGRAARERQRAWHMPLAFANGHPVAQGDYLEEQGTWRGRGVGGRVRGTAVRLGSMDERPFIPRNSIVVVPTVTPAMVFSVQGAAAIVAEHGGLLDHGAAMARELGVPCVVQCIRAWTDIQTGDVLWLDGDAGIVVRIENQPG